jgi:hypothetical protein
VKERLRFQKKHFLLTTLTNSWQTTSKYGNFPNFGLYSVTNENGFKIKASFFFLMNEIRIFFIFYLIYIIKIRKKSFYSKDCPLALITRRRRLSKASHAARTTCSGILAQIHWITFLNSGKVAYLKFISCPSM